MAATPRRSDTCPARKRGSARQWEVPCRLYLPARVSVAEARGLLLGLASRHSGMLVSHGPRRKPLGIVDLGILERACESGWGQRSLRELVLGALPEISGEPSLREAAQAAAGGVWLRDRRTWIGPQESRLTSGGLSPASRPLQAWLSELPGALRRAVRVLVRTFPDRDACLVGGPVRDLLRGEEVRDLDVCLRGPVRPVAERLAEVLRAGIELHPAFDTAALTLRDGLRVDLTAWRAETYPRPGALPHCRPGGLWDDLFRRDFTAHAMALALGGPWAGRILDVHGGFADLLERRRLRILHPLSFLDDPTRILRAARYAARLRLRVDRRTLAALRAAVDTGVLCRLSAARLRSEWVLLLQEGSAGAAVALLEQWGVLEALVAGWSVPRQVRRALPALLGAAARGPGKGDRARLRMGLGALLASVSPDGREAFGGRLGLGSRDQRWLRDAPEAARSLVRTAAGTRSPGVLHRRAWRFDDETVRVASALAGEAGTIRRLRRYLRLRTAARDVVRGEHLLRAGVPQDRRFAEILEAARAMWMDHPRGSAEQALERALRDGTCTVDTGPGPV